MSNIRVLLNNHQFKTLFFHLLYILFVTNCLMLYQLFCEIDDVYETIRPLFAILFENDLGFEIDTDYVEKIYVTSEYFISKELVLFSLNGSVYHDISDLLFEFLIYAIIVNVLIALTHSSIYFKFIKQLKREHAIDSELYASQVRDRNVRILNENLNHELNTALAIIQGNSDYIQQYLLSVLNDRDSKHISNKFEYMYQGLEAIQVVLARLGNYKQIKYSTKNKNVYEIANYATKSVSPRLSEKNYYDIIIDDSLKEFNLTKMNNADLMNVISQLTRNALEAKATSVRISSKYNMKNKKLYIYITDNGVGLRDFNGNNLKEEQYSQIFEAYVTSKVDERIPFSRRVLFKANLSTRSKTRGVGLYVAKMYLVEGGGSLKLKYTSNNGSVFEIQVKAEENMKKD